MSCCLLFRRRRRLDCACEFVRERVGWLCRSDQIRSDQVAIEVEIEIELEIRLLFFGLSKSCTLTNTNMQYPSIPL